MGWIRSWTEVGDLGNSKKLLWQVQILQQLQQLGFGGGPSVSAATEEWTFSHAIKTMTTS